MEVFVCCLCFTGQKITCGAKLQIQNTLLNSTNSKKTFEIDHGAPTFDSTSETGISSTTVPAYSSIYCLKMCYSVVLCVTISLLSNAESLRNDSIRPSRDIKAHCTSCALPPKGPLLVLTMVSGQCDPPGSIPAVRVRRFDPLAPEFAILLSSISRI